MTKHKLESDTVARILDHLGRARMARAQLRRSGLTADEIAERSGVHKNTVLRFLGLYGKSNTVDPRTSTTLKILTALGWKLELTLK